jgi:hypothetical protein
MTELSESRFNTLGEVVGGVRDNRQLGRVCVAVFPGYDPKTYVPMSETSMSAAGIPPIAGSLFQARIDFDALRAEEVAPSELAPLPTEDY